MRISEDSEDFEVTLKLFFIASIVDIEKSDSVCPHCIAAGYELLTLLPEQNLEMVTTQVVPWKGNAPHIA